MKHCKDCKHSIEIDYIQNPKLKIWCRNSIVVENWGYERIAKYARLYGPCKPEGKYWEAKNANNQTFQND